MCTAGLILAVPRINKKRFELCSNLERSVERETRFELATSTLARLHSTTELFPLVAITSNSRRLYQDFFHCVNKKFHGEW